MRTSAATIQSLQFAQAQLKAREITLDAHDRAFGTKADDILSDLVDMHNAATLLAPWTGEELRREPRVPYDVELQLELACLETLIRRDHPQAAPQLRALAEARRRLGSARIASGGSDAR